MTDALSLNDRREHSLRRAASAQAERPLSRPASPGARGRFSTALSAEQCAVPGTPAAEAPTAVIAEIKRRAPGQGDLAPALNPAVQALLYAAAGADALAVVTEPEGFGGSLADLEAVTAAVALPVLRKDLILTPYQVWETAEAGAAAALLTAASLPGDALPALVEECHACGLDALVEVHNEAEVTAALAAGTTLLCANNRDPHTLTVDLRVTEGLAALLPPGATLVSDGGIAGPADARRARQAGSRAITVGELLLTGTRCHFVVTIASLRNTGASS